MNTAAILSSDPLDPATPSSGAQIATRRRALAVSAALAATVLALTAVMWTLWPAPAGPTVLYAGTARYAVTATFDNVRVGMTAVEIGLTPRDDVRPSTATVQVQAVLVGMGHPTPPVDAVVGDSGGYRADAVPLMMTGRWEIHVVVRDASGTEDLVLPLAVTG